MQTLLQIVTNTPLWVWPLLALILWLGWQGTQSRVVPAWRLSLLPLIGLGMSLATIAQSVRPGVLAAAWFASVLVALPLGHAIGRRRAVRPMEDGRIEIAGGWFMLVFGLSIFAVRYALGVLFGVLQALKTDPAWIAVSGATSGFVAGIGLGWLGGVLLRARRNSLSNG